MPQSGTGNVQTRVIQGSNIRIAQLSPTGGVLPGTMTYTFTANVTYTMGSASAWSTAPGKSASSKLLKGKPGWKAKFQPRCAECGRFAVPSQKMIGMLECERCRGPVSRWSQ